MNRHVKPAQLFDDKPEVEVPVTATEPKRLDAQIPSPDPTDGEFDWYHDESVIIREQRATAVYFNQGGDIVIRQERGPFDEEDTTVIVTIGNADQLNGAIEKLRDEATHGG